MTNSFLFALFGPAGKHLPPASSKAKRFRIADAGKQAVVNITKGGWKMKGDNNGKKSPKDEEKKGKNGNAQKDKNNKKQKGKREKDNNGKKRKFKRRKHDADEDEDDEDEEKMNDDFEKYLLHKDCDPSSKVNSSNLLKKMKKSQKKLAALKAKMQKLMLETIEESVKGMKDAKHDLPEEDLLTQEDKVEDIEEDVQEEDLPEDDFEEPPHVDAPRSRGAAML